MKKFMIAVAVVIALYFAFDIGYYYFGLYIDFSPGTPVRVVSTSDEEAIYLVQDGQRVPFEVRGVTVGTGIPGEYGTDFAANRETYLRWFGQIAEMGANTVRATMLYDNDFYDALYDYNTANPGSPLYLIQGVTIKDALLGNSKTAMSSDILGTFQSNARAAVDAVHGRRKTYAGQTTGSGTYTRDVSPWVLAFMVGAEWDDKTIVYTNDVHSGDAPYQGTYLCAGEDANAFESFLANVGDHLIGYETSKYKQQRLFTFSSSPMTDPFTYDSRVRIYYKKIASLDIDNLVATTGFGGGLFASYNATPFQNNPFDMEKQMELLDRESAVDPSTLEDWELEELLLQQAAQEDTPPLLDLDKVLANSAAGQSDYRQYLAMLVEHHKYPVIVTEFARSSARGAVATTWDAQASVDIVNETEQARLMVEGLEDIRAAGCAGACLTGWQDEWDKKSWNTLEKVDLLRNLFWSDVQTSNQSLGVLAMDPGKEAMLCHVDGDDSDWEGVQPVVQNPGAELYCQYDERYLYLMVRLDGALTQPLYLPLDTTPKSGGSEAEDLPVLFARDADFLVVLDPAGESRLLVHSRYDALRALDSFEVYGSNAYANAPSTESHSFHAVNIPLKYMYYIGTAKQPAELSETGLLRQGISDPAHPEYDSLADYCLGDGFVELRLPWQLLNFSDPSRMAVHDDYYQNYGVQSFYINGFYVGAGFGGEAAIAMEAAKLQSWGNHVTYHERLKPAYYAVAEHWNAG